MLPGPSGSKNIKHKKCYTGTKRCHAINKWSTMALSRHKLGDLESTIMIVMVMVTMVFIILEYNID